MKITKQEILDTALDVFAERGYDSTILKDISDRLNVTKSALYKHYESKEALWDALIDHVEQYYSENFGNTESIVIPNGMDELTELTLRQLRFTMHDETVQKVRKLLTVQPRECSLIGDFYGLHNKKDKTRRSKGIGYLFI